MRQDAIDEIAAAAIWAGIVAGIVFVMMEMLLIMMTGGSPWGPPRMMGVILMGREVLPPPATFDFGVVMVGLAIHFVLSIIFGVVLGWAVSNWRLGMGAAVLAGVVFGLLIYLVNFYIFTALFPWFAMARTWITIVSHIVFGGVLGAVYRALAARHWARAGIA